ncbi:MAG: hypothetical protein HQK59_15910 [Deltaproteobacteria bacterium]|nr:hypothetical protein [Deltaproteobacteria bacterium]
MGSFMKSIYKGIGKKEGLISLGFALVLPLVKYFLERRTRLANENCIVNNQSGQCSNFQSPRESAYKDNNAGVDSA